MALKRCAASPAACSRQGCEQPPPLLASGALCFLVHFSQGAGARASRQDPVPGHDCWKEKSW